MATTATFNEPSSTQGSKRKRERDAFDTPSRSAQNRRTSHNDTTELSSFMDQTQDLDLSALQDPTTHDNSNTPHIHHVHTNMDTAAAALNQYTMTVPPLPAQNFIDQPTTNFDDAPSDFIHEPGSAQPGGGSANVTDGTSPTTPPSGALNAHGKPTVGSTEWHKVRKDNHKEVERRRRETINEGINELAKIVPGCEKNKGSILARAVQYIQKLQDDAGENIDKWTFEKLVTEQALADLSEKLSRAWREKEAWKKAAEECGVDVEAVELSLAVGDAGDDDGEDDEDGMEDGKDGNESAQDEGDRQTNAT